MSDRCTKEGCPEREQHEVRETGGGSIVSVQAVGMHRECVGRKYVES